MSELKIFEKEEFGTVRTTEIDGKVLFCGSDVAKALGYVNPRDAILKHCRCVAKYDIPHPQSPNKTIEVSFITEGDVYRLIAHSKLPSAQKFESWVFDEVLPTIRKNGSYEMSIRKTFAEALRLAADQQEQIEKQQLLLKEQAPKVEFAEAVTGSKDTIDMKSVAGLLNMNIGRNKLFEFLRNNKILNNDNCPYQRYCDLGYFRLIESKFTVNDETKISLKTVVFQKGVNFIRKLLIKEGYKENKGGKDEKRV